MESLSVQFLSIPSKEWNNYIALLKDLKKTVEFVSEKHDNGVDSWWGVRCMEIEDDDDDPSLYFECAAVNCGQCGNYKDVHNNGGVGKLTYLQLTDIIKCKCCDVKDYPKYTIKHTINDTIEVEIWKNQKTNDFSNSHLDYINSLTKIKKNKFINSLQINERTRNNLRQRLNYRKNPDKYKMYVRKYNEKKIEMRKF